MDFHLNISSVDNNILFKSFTSIIVWLNMNWLTDKYQFCDQKNSMNFSEFQKIKTGE